MTFHLNTIDPSNPSLTILAETVPFNFKQRSAQAMARQFSVEVADVADLTPIAWFEEFSQNIWSYHVYCTRECDNALMLVRAKKSFGVGEVSITPVLGDDIANMGLHFHDATNIPEHLAPLIEDALIHLVNSVAKIGYVPAPNAIPVSEFIQLESLLLNARTPEIRVIIENAQKELLALAA